MRINVLYFIIVINVLGTCLGYKLRRDIRKVRHYCKEICTQCGGEAALSRDVCICNTEEAEGEDVQHCLEQARNKFEFLGIKLEADNLSVNKRSIYKPYHLSHSEDQGTYLHMEPDQEKRAIFKRSSLVKGINKGVYREQKLAHYGNPTDTDDKLRSKRSYDDYDSWFEIPGFADLFRENYPIRPPTNFKILFGSPTHSSLDSRLFYDMTQRKKYDDEDCSEGENDSTKGSDYADGQTALADELNLRRLDNKETNMYELIPPPDVSRVDGTTAKQFSSIWNSVLLDVLDPDYFLPANFKDNDLFL